MAMPGEIDRDTCGDEDCGRPLELQVCMSPAGYYIGTECPMHGPNSRESGYFRTRVEADEALVRWHAGDKVGKRDTEFHPDHIEVVEITPDMRPSDLMALLDISVPKPTPEVPEKHRRARGELAVVLNEVGANEGRKKVWTDALRRAGCDSRSLPAVAAVAMQMALDDMQMVFEELQEQGILHWFRSEPNDNEVLITIPLGGVVGDELKARCLEVTDGDQDLATRIYDQVVAHQIEHDLDDNLPFEAAIEMEVIVGKDSPLALKYGKEQGGGEAH